MKTNNAFSNHTGRFTTACPTKLLPLFLLLVLHAVVQAQFTFMTNNGAITITGYTGTNTVVTIPSMITGLPVTSIGEAAFYNCFNGTSVTIPNSVTSIEGYAFSGCSGLTGVYCQGNAPTADSTVFSGDNNATVYYLPGTTGWGTTIGDRPTALWFLSNPLILNNGPSFGVQSNGFGFIISWATNISVVVETSTNLASPLWLPLATNTLTGGWSYFSDPQWTNYAGRFYRLRTTTANTPFTSDGMALIPAGSFTMGDTLDGESDAIPTSVYVSAFYMDTNQVSYSQWQTVYNWAIANGYGFDNPGSGKAANHPVQTVDWYDVVKWCNARSQQAGKTPVYYTDAGMTQVYTTGEVTPYVNWSAKGYRLPTEAEWEKAARGGLSGQRFPWGNTISWSQANYYGDPLSLDRNGYAYDLAAAIGYDPAFSGGDNRDYPYTSPVGTFPANGYGLNDMAGNVTEWCWDWYGTPYAGGTDPRGPTAGSNRVLRGGTWFSVANGCRSAYRVYDYPSDNGDYVGFRSVLLSGQ